MKNRTCLMIFLIAVLTSSLSTGKTTPVLAHSSGFRLVSSDDSLVANFTHSPMDVAVTRPVNFTDHSTGDIMLWEWNFGDGTTANATTAQDANRPHIYNSTSVKLVQLFVTDALNNTASASVAINVRKIHMTLILGNATFTTQGSVALMATLGDEFGNYLGAMRIFFAFTDNLGQNSNQSTFTDTIGRATVYYQPQGSGVYQVTASFNGTDIFSSAVSQTQTFQVGINLIPYAAIFSVAIIVMSAVLAYLRRRARKAVGEEAPTSEKEKKTQ